MAANKDSNHRRQRNRQRKGWGFSFFGQTSEASRNEDNIVEFYEDLARKRFDAETYFPLARTRAGDRVSIIGFKGKGGISHLLSLGLTPGIQVQVVSCVPSGSVIVAFGDNRIGLGAGMANKILVTQPHQVNSWEQEKAMNTDTYIRNLTVGSKGRIVGYEKTTGGYKGRLLAMGLTPGTEFTVIRHAPLGDPIEIKVRGFNLSLRRHEADVLCIEEVDENE